MATTESPTYFFNEIHNRVVGGARATTRELLQIAETEAKKALEERRINGRPSTGMLVGSFEQKPIRNQGNREFSGLLFVGGTKAPYAIYVDKLGWTTKEGHKDGYEFMQAGLDKADEAAQEVFDKQMKKIR